MRKEKCIIRIFDDAQAWQQQVAPSSRVRDIVRKETVESKRGAPICGQGWLPTLGAVLSNSCRSRRGY